MGCEFTPLTSLYKNNTSDITAIPAGLLPCILPAGFLNEH